MGVEFPGAGEEGGAGAGEGGEAFEAFEDGHGGGRREGSLRVNSTTAQLLDRTRASGIRSDPIARRHTSSVPQHLKPSPPISEQTTRYGPHC